ncbi:hypothetical protein HMPREF2826_00575 [Olsenella sp. HMSC062G07]|nr:hypothetical protein HMPREF2826_00575 [Olsenella sp. HMSC062G07]
MPLADELTYTGSTGEAIKFGLAGNLRIDDGDTLRSRVWSRTLGYRSLEGVTRSAREVTMEVVVVGAAEADRIRRVLDYDMALNSPGTLEMGGWSQRALVPESQTDVWRVETFKLSLTVALLDGVWRRSTVEHFLPRDEAIDDGVGKGYPHGYPYGYGRAAAPSGLVQPGYLPAPMRLTIFGPASAPSVTIGGNTYRYSADIPSGGFLVIDGVSKTATLTNINGSATNALGALSLGSGEGSGTYAFERVQPGRNRVLWDGSFGFDVETMQEEGEAPWLLT